MHIQYLAKSLVKTNNKIKQNKTKHTSMVTNPHFKKYKYNN
jgi:hypothetical protein